MNLHNNAQKLPEETKEPGLRRRMLRLIVGLAVFWFIVQVLAPLPAQYIAPFRRYAEAVDKTGITPGALYYTDIDQSIDAEANNRDAIRFGLSGRR
ncbi:MAG: hypothetical protein LBH65_06355 [Desulfovibrio sp.]|jgi:hypothetical protein|nr:hypothetical protein [Desulfovibrio sp.]